MTETSLTPEFRASFVFVFNPQKAMEAGKPDKFSITMLFPLGADLSVLKKAANEVLQAKFGARLMDPVKGPALKARLRSPFRDQGEKAYNGYVPGAVFVTATSMTKPGLVDHNTADIIDPAQFYSGAYARATLRAFAYEKAGNVGVSFEVHNVQKLRDGESLSGRMKAQDEFEPVKTAGSSASNDMFS